MPSDKKQKPVMRRRAQASWLLHAFVCLHLLALAPVSSKAMVDQSERVSIQTNNSSRKPELVAQLGHSNMVNSAIFSPDGKYVLTASDDKTARLWELESGREVRRFEGHSAWVNSAIFSPDGKNILTSADDETVLWEVESGRRVGRLKGGSGIFSSDGRYMLTASWDKTARLCEVESGREVRRFEGHSKRVRSAIFSSDGKYVLTASDDKTARLWELESGREVRRFEGHSDGLISAIFSPDGRYTLTTSEDKTARLWELESGREVRRFEGHSDSVQSAIFSSDGKYVLTASRDRTARLWEVESGQEVRRFEGHSFWVNSAIFSPDGRYILSSSAELVLWEVETGREVRRFQAHSGTFSSDGKYVLSAAYKTASMWRVESGREVRRFEGHSRGVSSAIFSSDGRYILCSSDDGTARMWEVESGREVRKLEGHSLGVRSAIFSSDGKYVLTASGDKTARLWEAESGRELRRFEGHSDSVNSAIFSPDGRYVLTTSDDTTARLWEVESGREVRRFEGHSDWVQSASFSADGKYVLTAGLETARLWQAESAREVRRFEGYSQWGISATFSPDGKYVLTANGDKTARLWEAESGRELRKFEGPSGGVLSAIFSADGKYLLTVSTGTAQLWEVENGREVRRFEGYSGWVRSAVFSFDGKYMLTASLDGTSRLWSISTGKELCELISFSDGSWAVVDPEGHFDTNNLDEIKGLHWIMPDDPMKPLPIEIFMRDYYEPSLLPRLLNGETFNTKSIATLNRVQPTVAITSIESQKDSAELVTVKVNVAKATDGYGIGKVKTTRETDVYDVRLFRDGQIVGQYPQNKPMPGSIQVDLTDEQRLRGWRERAKVRPGEQVKAEANGSRTIIFKDIKLPGRTGGNPIKFSAYGFNDDRVKSTTFTKTYDPPQGLPLIKGKAYIVTVGVNRYQNKAWDLRYAANDARDAQRLLVEKIKQAGEYAEVTGVSLVSAKDKREGEREATKANFKTALEEIARKARPEDLVIIDFSSHGYADKHGQFYLFPTDIGPGSEREVNAEVLARAISGEELSEWIRDVDAGEMVMVVDACQSAGTVKGEGGEEFKPGPMGSRGLGQLAYDKGMRILAASQADDFAFELEELQHGLLTFALINDGIQARKADMNKDAKITLSEALVYSLDRVPKLYEAMVKKELKKLFESEGGKGPVVTGAAASLNRKNTFQRASLFDFAKGRREVVLVK
jgi:WD40 repeat protein